MLILKRNCEKKYNIIYSLGTDCACALYLKESNLRKISGPFDWLTGVGFEERINLILNDFENFINIEDFIKMPKTAKDNENEKLNDFYKNTKTNFLFLHDFPKEIPLENSFKKVKEKYNRRITRFFKLIKKDNVLLVFFAHYSVDDNNKIIDLCNKVINKFNKKIDFAIITHDPSKKLGEIKEEVLSKNIKKYSLYTIEVDENNNPTTIGNHNDCIKIFKKFKIKKPFCQKLLKSFANFIGIFIPFKKVRKNIRQRIRNID